MNNAQIKLVNKIDELAEEIYKQNKDRGWWDDPNRDKFQTLQLVNTEIAEATEGDRKSLMDDHLKDHNMAEVEIADTFIRILDFAGRYELVIDYLIIEDIDKSIHEMKTLAGKHLFLTKLVCDFGYSVLMSDSKHDQAHYYTRIVNGILQICNDENYDLWGVVEKKLAYNKKRADHNREDRQKDGGKKY